MEMLSLKCPHCTADLEIENDIDSFYCKYCGTKIILSGLDSEVIKARVRYKEMQHEKDILAFQANEKEKEYGRFSTEREKDRKHEIKRIGAENRGKNGCLITLLILVGLYLLFMAVVFLIVPGIENIRNETIYKATQQLVDEGRYEEAMEKASKISDSGLSDIDWRKSQEELFRSIREEIAKSSEIKDIKILLSSDSIKKMKYQDVVEYLYSLGFYDISTIHSAKHRGFFHKYSQVESISINGISEFLEEDIFPIESKIIISYYN